MFLKLFTKQEAVLKLGIRQLLFLSCAFSCLLLSARVVITDERSFLFLAWNLFLAFVPYAITEWLSRRVATMENPWKRWSILIVWLLFIPNSFYIMTDLFHLQRLTGAPKWFDVLLIFSFAWNGMLFGILSVRKVELILGVVQGKLFSFLFVMGVMWLNAFGIYLGRYLRYNSWDIVTQPVSLFEEVVYMFSHPLQNRMEWSMVTIWSIFMTLFYFTIKKLAENFLSNNNSIKQ
jgi:uncharacterized membrane protein